MISLYTATVPAFRQTIAATRGVLAKGAAFAAEHSIDPATLVDARLAPDMLPLAYQVQSVVTHSCRALDGVRAGEFAPYRAAFPTDFAAMDTLLAEAAATLAAVDPAEIDGLMGRDMVFAIGSRRVPYLAEDFLLSFSLPNVYFHATTAYDILRARGVPLGKSDYLGRPRFKA
jgi:hypothetical protein